MVRKATVLVYGGAVYALFLVVFAHAIGFVGNLAVPKGIDDGPAGPWWAAVAVNATLLAVFATRHSVMARPGFKRWWTRAVPRSVERTTFVLAATGALALLMWQWRPLATEVWSLDTGGPGRSFGPSTGADGGSSCCPPSSSTTSTSSA